MKCIICNNTMVPYTENTKNHNVYHCKLCNVYSNYFDEKNSNDVRQRYEDGKFWEDTNYNVAKMIKADFEDNEGKHFFLNWKSMYSYCRDYLSDKKTILEIGAGTGVHLIMFDKIGFKVTGVEPDLKNSQLINEKLKNGTCINGFIEDLKFENKFDVIWLYHVVEHLPRPDLLLKNCYDLSHDDGIIIIAVQDCENLDTLKNSLKNPDHLWHFTKNSLRKLSINLGYEVMRCDSLAQIKQLNIQRLHRVLTKYKMISVTENIWPYWPLKLTKRNDGYELRLILRKKA